MIKKIGLTAALSALLLSGCGGGSSDVSTSFSTEEIAAKEIIFIYSGLPAEACVDVFAQTETALDQTNIESSIATTVANGTTCATYGRDIETDYTCLEHTYTYGDSTCLYAFDQTETALNKEEQIILLNEEVETLIVN